MKVIVNLEEKIKSFSLSDEDTIELNLDESVVLYSFSEEYDRLASHKKHSGLMSIFGNKDEKAVYLGDKKDSKIGKLFYELYSDFGVGDEIVVSLHRVSKNIGFEESEILNRIYVDLKDKDIKKNDNGNLVIRK